MQPGDWPFSLDVQKGYMQWLLTPMRKGCEFRLNARLYRNRVMPFGLNSALEDFSYAVKRGLALFHKRGVRRSFYTVGVMSCERP